MRVTVRLFARLREIAGADTLDLELPDRTTVAGVWRAVAERWPAMGAFDSTVSGAVNADYAQKTRVVEEGDEVAFLPPVSGG